MYKSRKAYNSIRKALRPVFFAFITMSMLLPFDASAGTLQVTNANVKVDGTTATFTWTTNVPTSGRIDFGFDTNYSFYVISGEKNMTDHTLSISNLDSEVTYHYRITSGTPEETVSTFDRAFKTGKSTTKAVPIISKVNVASVTGTTFTVQWETDRDANGTVRVGKTQNYTGSAGHGDRKRTHDVTVGGLTIGNTYHFQISSTDKDNVTGYYSDLTVTTLPGLEAERMALQILDIRPSTINDPGIETDRVIISWNTNKLASTSLRYGPLNHINASAESNAYRTFTHQITLTNLTPGTIYSLEISARDVFGATITVTGLTFQTRSSPVVLTPVSRNPKTPVVATKASSPIVRVLGFTTSAPDPLIPLYRIRGTHDMFAVIQGQKYPLYGTSSLQRYDFKSGNVKDVSAEFLDQYSYVRLIRATDSPTVYYLYQRDTHFLKLALPSVAVFESYPLNRWNDVIDVRPFDLSLFETAVLVKTPGSHTIHYLSLGEKHAISSPEVFDRLGFSYENVVEISDAHLATFPLGDDIK